MLKSPLLKDKTKKTKGKAKTSLEASTTASLCGTTATSRTSPRKKAACNKNCCDHSDIDGFENYGSNSHTTYFATKYLADHELFPSQCTACKRNFVLKKQIDCSANEWSVKDGKVRLCKNGANSLHECTYGLCGECSEKNGVVTPQTRKKRRSLKASSESY